MKKKESRMNYTKKSMDLNNVFKTNQTVWREIMLNNLENGENKCK